MSFSTAAGANYWQAAYASPFVQTGRPFTVMAWVNMATTSGNWNAICSTYDGTAGGGWEFGAANSTVAAGETVGGWYFTWSNAGSYEGCADAATGGALSSVLAVNVWYHLCVRFGIDGGLKFDQVENGIVVGTSIGGAGSAIPASSRKLRLHQTSDNPNVGLPGRTACIRMFEGILTLEQVNQNRSYLTCPIAIRHRCIVDLPGRRSSQDIPVDLGPRNLGFFTKVGTVSTSFDPNVAKISVDRQIMRVMGSAAAAASVVYAGRPGRQAANRAGTY